MITDSNLIPDDLILNLLREHLKSKLQTVLMETAKKEIENIVNETMKSLETDLYTMYDYEKRQNLIKLIFEYKKPDKKPG